MALPDPGTRPCVSADEAFAELGIERNTGYRAIRAGTFPLPVIRVGRVIRVPTAALRQLLLIDPPRSDAAIGEYPDQTAQEGAPDEAFERARPDAAHRGSGARRRGSTASPSAGAA